MSNPNSPMYGTKTHNHLGLTGHSREAVPHTRSRAIPDRYCRGDHEGSEFPVARSSFMHGASVSPGPSVVFPLGFWYSLLKLVRAGPYVEAKEPHDAPCARSRAISPGETG